MTTSDNNKFKTSEDSMGTVKLPIDALYGAQTQRAVDNFQISELKMPKNFIKSLGFIKIACSKANCELNLLDASLSEAINSVALDISQGKYLDQFPIDVFQTGSGTSTNMNINEVIATIANNTPNNKTHVHPNDHVNMSQSSNDTIPTAISVTTSVLIKNLLIPSLEHLEGVITQKASDLKNIVKTGRTHLMDAMPIRFDQELLTWASQINSSKQRILSSLPRLNLLPQGGTAIGTGINAHPEFSSKFCQHLSKLTNIDFKPNSCLFESISSQDTIVEVSGQLKTLAVSLMKISNDLRWMNSGPLAGLAEIELPALQPGSSIMPGKVNPVIPEAVCMVAAKVIGNDSTITIAGQSGNFQLNVMLPVIAHSITESIEILSNAMMRLADKAIKNFTVNQEHIQANLDKNPILVTALNPIIGYEKGANIAKTAYKNKAAVKDVTLEMTDLSADEINRILDPINLTKGGISE